MAKASTSVSLLDSSGAATWAEYLDSKESNYTYHRLAVRDLIEGTFGHRSIYLTATRGSHPVGILPMFEMKSMAFGRLLISLPFVTRGGTVADDAKALNALLVEAERIGERLKVDRVEIRGGDAFASEYADRGWTSRHHKATLSVDVSSSADNIFEGLSSRLRGKIRKAERSGARFETGGAELLPEFYSVFARNMRDLGTPVYPLRLFERFLQDLVPKSSVLLVRRDGEATAGAIGLRVDDTLELPWICSNRDYSRHNVNEYLYWQAIRLGADDRNVSWVELGRSTTGSGPYRFKMQWRPNVEPLTWYYKTIRSATIKTDADSPRYRAARYLWRKLPLALTKIIGPRVVRNIP